MSHKKKKRKMEVKFRACKQNVCVRPPCRLVSLSLASVGNPESTDESLQSIISEILDIDLGGL